MIYDDKKRFFLNQKLFNVVNRQTKDKYITGNSQVHLLFFRLEFIVIRMLSRDLTSDFFKHTEMVLKRSRFRPITTINNQLQELSKKDFARNHITQVQ